MIRKLLKFIGRKGAFWFGINVTAGGLFTLVELLISLILALLLKSFGITHETPHLPLGVKLTLSNREIIAALLIVGLIRGFAMFLVNQSGLLTRELISLRLRLLLFYDTFALRSGLTSTAELNTQLGENFVKTAGFCQGCSVALPLVFQSLFLAILLLRKSPLETLVGLAGVGVVGLLVHFLSNKGRQISALLPSQYESVWGKVFRSIRNAFLLKSLKTTDLEHGQIIEGTLKLSNLSIRSQTFAGIAACLTPIFGITLVTGMIALYLSHPNIPGVDFVAYLYLFLRFVQGLANLAASYSDLSNVFPQSLSSFRYFFSFEQDVISQALSPITRISATGRLAEKPPTPRVSPSERLKRPPRLLIDRMSFSYPGAKLKVVEDLSLKVDPGEQLAIVGPSGAGKSTLVALIMGVLTPGTGEVTLDGASPENYFQGDRARVGYVGPEPFLIHGTVRENLLYGNLDPVSEEEILAMLTSVQLSSWLEQTPARLDFRLNENGDGMSAGQKQRLSLARALLRNPNLLILDEVTSNLDAATEREIAGLIARMKGKCTTVIVSHREALIQGIENRLKVGGEQSSETATRSATVF